MFRRINKRPKRAAQRHVPHSRVDVNRIVVYPDGLCLEVTYLHALSTWDESVRFTVVGHTESVLTVAITDTDYPADRARLITLPPTTALDQFARDYLIAGRW